MFQFDTSVRLAKPHHFERCVSIEHFGGNVCTANTLRPAAATHIQRFLLTGSAFVMPDRYSIMSSTVSKWNPCGVLFGVSDGVSCPSSGGPLVSDLTSNLGPHCPWLQTEL